MRRFAIAASGGACLLLAAAVACGSAQPCPYSKDKSDTDKQSPAKVRVVGAWSDSDQQAPKAAPTQSGQVVSAERPTDYGTDSSPQWQRRHDWYQDGYRNAQCWTDRSFRNTDWTGPYCDYGAIKYQATGKDARNERSRQPQAFERTQIVQALSQLDEADQQKLFNRFSRLPAADRMKMCKLFGIGEGEWQQKYNSPSYRGREKDKYHCQNGEQRKGNRPDRRPAQPRNYACKTDNKNPEANRRSDWSRPGNWGPEERRFVQSLTRSLKAGQDRHLAAVKSAKENLTPQQRLQIFEPLLAQSGGSQESRTALYLILIETYRDMNNMDKSMELVQAMVSEYPQ